MLRVAGIMRDSTVDGPGVRNVLFLQGCTHNCPGCHNPETHDLNGGELRYTAEVLHELTKDNSNGITISGGEPLLQWDSLRDLIGLASDLGRSVWMYTGYTATLKSAWMREAWLQGLECVVDGKFKEDQADKSLQFRGSRNQRIIDIDKSFRAGKIVEWEDTYGKYGE